MIFFIDGKIPECPMISLIHMKMTIKEFIILCGLFTRKDIVPLLLLRISKKRII